MKTRLRSMKLLAMTVALTALAAVWIAWGARPAKAIIVIGGKTGFFTLIQGQAVRVHAVNAGGEVAIIDDGDIFDYLGNSLIRTSTRIRVEPGRGTSLFDFTPQLADGERLPVRVQVRFESASSKSGSDLIFTAEVYDTATGKTSILLGQDFIIDDGK